jgi:CheY-like chemotaxis protein
VDTVSNGSDAVAAHRSNPYDLILMDLHMPDMDGWEATWHIRSSKQPQPQVVAVSADVLGQVRGKCQEARMDDYLSKPFTAAQLLAVIARARDRQSCAAEMHFAT